MSENPDMGHPSSEKTKARHDGRAFFLFFSLFSLSEWEKFHANFLLFCAKRPSTMLRTSCLDGQSLHADDGAEFLYRLGALLQRGIFLGRQRDLDDLLQPA
jgi:hypothetical protein